MKTDFNSGCGLLAETPRGAVLQSTTVGGASHAGLQSFHDLDELLAAGPWDLVLLDCPGVQAGQLLFRLRCQEAYRFVPIYCCRDEDDWCHALGDGEPPEPGALAGHWREQRERLARFDHGRAPTHFESRVLAWLWLRPHSVVRAVRDPAVARHYRYPLLEALAGGEEINEFVWLQLMSQQGWLEAGKLVDRLRLCSHCGSGRLNYVDVCPECRSLDIGRQPSLHCFTCGNVGPQELFLKDGLLVCPNCLTRLRHIGSDYDRPLENYLCRHCRAFFIDAAVEARCLDCGEAQAPDKLRVREVRHYHLTESGRLRCRQGLGHSPQVDVDAAHPGLCSGQEFLGLLDWQIGQARRYDDPPFSLLGVRLPSLADCHSLPEERRVQALVDGLLERLLEGVRETDRCLRSSEDTFWLLLLHTGEEGLACLLQRLEQLGGLFGEATSDALELRTASITAPQELLGQEDGRLLMARLAAKLA